MKPKKLLLSAVLSALLLQPAALASDLSDWAVNDYVSANQVGLVPLSVASQNLQKNITREEFCELSVNLYQRITGETLVTPIGSPFIDTTNVAVNQAYLYGIVSGTSETTFSPTEPVTRQEAAKMLVSALTAAEQPVSLQDGKDNPALQKFEDYNEISDWARPYVATTLSHGLMKGTAEMLFSPLGNTTREQAVVAVSRTYSGFSESDTQLSLPEIVAPENGETAATPFTVSWKAVDGVTTYNLIFKDHQSDSSIIATAFNIDSLTLEPGLLLPGHSYTLSISAELEEGLEIFSLPVDFTYNAPPTVTQPPVSTSLPSRPPVSGNNMSVAQKEELIFGSAGAYYNSQEEAIAHMKEVTVNVWNLNSDGSKVASTRKVTVHEALADDVAAIFDEIFNDPSQFPIYSVGGYSWRQVAASGSRSQHSYGTCIDINPNENYYVRGGTIYSGSYWKPGEDPYSITPDGAVVRTFADHGWVWGGNAWSSSNDYMHFSFLGK